MSLSVKASPSMILLALRAIGSSTAITKGINYAYGPLRQSQTTRFSTVAASKDLVDTALSNFFKYEINSVKSFLKDSQVKASSDFFPFEITVSCRGFINLEKKFHSGEKVIVTSIGYNFDNDNCEEDKERDGSKKEIKAIRLSVEVHKPGKYGGMMSFIITVSEEDTITIHHLKVQNFRKYYEHNSELDGPRIREMDYELQRCLSKYLEIRGITRNVASFLLESNHIPASLNQYKKLIEKEKVAFSFSFPGLMGKITKLCNVTEP